MASFNLLDLNFLPSLLILILPVLIPRLLPKFIKNKLRAAFGPFLTLAEIYPPDVAEGGGGGMKLVLWKTVLLVGAAGIQGLGWITWSVVGSLDETKGLTEKENFVAGTIGVFWIYSSVVNFLAPSQTIRPRLLIFYTIQLVSSLLVFLTATFTFFANDRSTSFPLSLRTFISEGVATVLDLVVIGVSLSLYASEVPQAFIDEVNEKKASGRLGPSPEDTTSALGWLTFSWVTPIIELGNSGYLKEGEVFTLSPTQAAPIVFKTFQRAVATSLSWKLLKTNGRDLTLDAVFTYLSVLCVYGSAFCIKGILDCLTSPSAESIAKAYVFALSAFLITVVKAQSDVNHLWFSRRAGARIQTALASAVYEKALKRKDFSGVTEGKGTSGVGKIIQLMQSDVTQISNLAISSFQIYSAPFEIIVCCIFLYSMLGWSAFVGLFALLLATPAQRWFNVRNIDIQERSNTARDARVNMMEELITGAKMIKFFAWEGRWVKKVKDARNKELAVLIEDRVLGSCNEALFSIVASSVTVFSFLSYVTIQKGELSVGTAFTSLSLLGMLQGPLMGLPRFYTRLLKNWVSLRRIEDYLLEDEVPAFVSSMIVSVDSTEGEIGFIDASFRWNAGIKDKDASKGKDKKKADAKPPATSIPAVEEVPVVEARVFELNNISFVFPSSGLTVVTGATGSGKTALLLALLGELTIVSGHVLLPKDLSHVDKDGLTNSCSYSSQTAWLQNLTIRENILFGSPFEQDRYDAVLRACCLLPDLNTLEDGDETEIGSKGVSLSGGQKARVALARSVYSRAKNVLLDDPLAAVDSHTAAALVDNCLSGPLMDGRTVIIVSHHVELLLPIAHSLIRVVDGRLDVAGSVQDLRARGELAAVVEVEEKLHAEEETVLEETPEKVEGYDQPIVVVEKKKAKKMVKDEEREVGSVRWETYKLYFAASGFILCMFTFAFMAVTINFSIVERWWIKEWTESYKTNGTEHVVSISSGLLKRGVNTLSSLDTSQTAFSLLGQQVGPRISLSSFNPLRPDARTHPLFYVGIYAAITLADGFAGVLSSVASCFTAYRASKRLHNSMLASVIKCPPRWFDVTPSGRIVSRFSRDLQKIDEELPFYILYVAHYVFQLAGAIILVLAIVPLFALPGLCIALVYAHLTGRYIRTGRDLKRMESIALSPVLSGFSSMLDGVVTIRAFSAEKRFFAQYQEDFDKSRQMWWWQWMSNRWCLLRFDVIGGISVLFASLLTIYQGRTAGLGGMAIISAQSVTMGIYWTSRFYADLEQQMNSMERVKEYLHLPSEAPNTIPETTPPAYWPSSSGETLISVKDLVISYAPELPPVIHGISFDIKPREKIGLIGRTGSGKSTLGMSFLRFADPISGSITINGIDITTIGLDDLRSSISLVPQDAILFAGNIRDNLDPFQEHSDEDLRDALTRVQLGTPTSSGPSRAASSSDLIKLGEEADSEANLKAEPIASGGGKISITLDTEVSAGGANFSQGQRQLLALARALLRRNNIIIMDEATASVDFSTDTLIQQTIKEEFKDAALITIAHRLSSIIDYDRLLVLDQGRLLEFDTPFALLSKPSGEDAVFKGMVEKSGKFDQLYAAAEAKVKASA
ncbi:hypothetical protein BDY24DRAFT_374236 [Mrakia frigida]|uniref:uncharacterized protein n=1 Tax=Mrakia frigida TaxID=29902 RepID=UPI003FCC26E3